MFWDDGVDAGKEETADVLTNADQGGSEDAIDDDQSNLHISFDVVASNIEDDHDHYEIREKDDSEGREQKLWSYCINVDRICWNRLYSL